MQWIDALGYEEVMTFLRSTPANLFFKDTECRYLFISDVRTFFPYGEGQEEDVLGKTDLEIWSSEEQARFYYEQDQKVLATGKGTGYITEVPREDGTVYYQIKKNPVVLEGKIIGIVGLIGDITERVRLEKQAENWAIHDELTGLYNRNYLKVKGAEQLKGAIMPITIIMGDCNYLKRVNDAYGHEYGDLLLKDKKYNDLLTFLRRQHALSKSTVEYQSFLGQAYEALGKVSQSHQAIGEMYALQGQRVAAIQQLSLAQKANDGDFYTMSEIDARLRELRRDEDFDRKHSN